MNSVGASISSNSVIGTGVRNRSKYKVKALERLTSLPKRHTDRVSDIRPRNANKFKKANDNMLSEQMVVNMLVIISSKFVKVTVLRVGNRYEMKLLYIMLRRFLHVMDHFKNSRRLTITDWSKLDDPIVYISFFAVSVTGRQSIQAVVINVNTQRDLAVLEVKSFDGLPRSLDRVSDIRPESANKFKKAHDNTLSEQMVDNMSVKMKSVGAIVSSNSVGTVFRVGSKYVMTAFHVVENIINPRKLPSIADDDWSKLDDPTVYIRFTASVMDLLSPIFYIKPVVIYMNKQLDIAVLELKSLEGLPPSLKLSKDMGQVKCVNIIGFGHPTDPRKQLDANCEVLNNNHIITDIDNYFNANPSFLQLNGLPPNYIKGEYIELWNTDMFPLHTFFEHGSSGAPAILENEVVGILVKGIPDIYYNRNNYSYFTASVIDKLPKNLMFELCVKTESIFNDMRSVEPMLAADLFD